MTTNNILYVSDGNYGTPAGRLLPLVQGQFGQSVPLEIRNLDGSIPNLTGYTFTATKRQGSTVTAWVGSIVLSGTPAAAPQATMAVNESDTGEGGGFSFFLEMTNGTQVLKTHPVSLTIATDPAVNATAAPGLVGVTTAQKLLLGTIASLTGLVEMAAGSATGVAIQAFMRTFLGSANDAAARTAIGAEMAGAAATVQTNLTSHTGASTTVHGIADTATLPTAASAFETDNRVLRSDGTGRGVQSSGVTIDDAGDVYATSALGLGSVQVVSYAGNQVRWGLASSWFQHAWYTDAVLRMLLDINGWLGIGAAIPRGKLHLYDTDTGWLFVRKVAIDGTSQEILPDAAGDVVYGLAGTCLVRDSTGVLTVKNIAPAVAPGTTLDLINDGTNILRLTVTAGGQVTVARFGGSRTFNVTFQLMWQ